MGSELILRSKARMVLLKVNDLESKSVLLSHLTLWLSIFFKTVVNQSALVFAMTITHSTCSCLDTHPCLAITYVEHSSLPTASSALH